MNEGEDDRLSYTPASKARLLSLFRRRSIEFLIEISEVDPVALVSPDRPGDALNFATKLYRSGFLGAGVWLNADATAKVTERAQGLADQIVAHPKRTLAPLIRGIKDLLDTLIDGADRLLRLPAGCALRFDARLQKMTEGVGEFSPQQAHRVAPPFNMVRLHLPDGASLSTQLLMVVFSAMQVLDSEEGAMVRRCRREACGKIFLATRPSKVFCGRPCANAVTFERHAMKPGYVERHRKAAKENARLRRDLEKKQLQLQQKLQARGETKNG